MTKKTSTISGIREAEQNIKKGLRERAGQKGVDITDDDIEDFYELLGDDEKFKGFTDLVGDSNIWAVIREANESHDTINDFAERLNTFARFYEGESNTVFDDLPDSDTKEEIERLYNKYIK